MGSGKSKSTPVQSKEEAQPPVSVTSGEIKGISAGVVNVHCINQEIKGVDGGGNRVDQTVELRKDIRSMLVTRYMNMTLPRGPWLKNLVLPMDKYYVSLMLHQTPINSMAEEPLGKYIVLEELFLSTGSERPHRILVEGAPGYGKTTFVLKIAFDWVKGAPYMMGFDLVFIVFLRHFESSLEEMLAEAAATDDVDPDKALEAIKLDTSKVLLLLDGYDEMKESAQSLLLPLLQRRKFPHMTVLVTSRTGKLTLLEDNDLRNALVSSEIGSLMTDFWNKKLLIKGISEKQQDIFLRTYLSPEYNFDAIASRFKTTIGTKPKELLSCPLFLLLLAMLVIDSDLKQPQNKTQLYLQVFNFMIRKWLNRQNQSDEIVNIYQLNSDNVPRHIDLLVQFGGFALRMLHEDKMSFTPSEILSCCDEQVLSMGFLTQATTIQRKRSLSFYEPLHKTLLEFLAAYHLWYKYCQNEHSYFEQEILAMKDLSVQEVATSLFLPFLAGLLGDKVEVLFKLFLPDDFQFSSYFYSIVGVLMECNMTDRLVQLITPLIPHLWIISWFVNDEGFSTSPSHFTILRHGLISGRIKIIQWNLQCKTHLPPKYNVDRLVLLIKFPLINVDLLSCKDVKCQELLFHFAEAPSDLKANSISMMITNASVINATRVSFDIKSSSGLYLPAIYQALANDCIKMSIHRLSCVINGKDNSLISQLVEIVEKNRISILDLTLSEKKESVKDEKSYPFTQKMFSGIVNAIKSDELKELVVFNGQKLTLNLNLSQLCTKNKTSWRRIWLTNVDIHVDKGKELSLVIEDIKLFDVKNTTSAIQALSQCKCTAMTCELAFLCQLVKEVPEQWTGFESIAELTIILREYKVQRFPLKFLQIFESLRTLSIHLSKSANALAEEFLWLFQNLGNLRVFEVWEAEKDLEFLHLFIDGISRLSECLDRNVLNTDASVNSFSIDTLKVQIDLSDKKLEALRYNFFTLLTNVKRLLNSMCVGKMCIVIPRNPSMRLEVATFIGNIFPRDDNYTITHDLDGMNGDDTYHSRTYYDYNVIFERYSIMKR